MTISKSDQSVIGKILDFLNPPGYGFCLNSYTRKTCEYFRLGECQIWVDTEDGGLPSECTGRRS